MTRSNQSRERKGAVIRVQGCTITRNGETPCPALLLLCSPLAAAKPRSQKLTALSEEFVYGSLAFSPSAATAAGLHQYQKQNLDEMLDDFSPESLARQRTFYEKFSDRLADLKTGRA